jgi:maleylpyruvate isomerase
VTPLQKDAALAWWADGELAVAGRLDALSDDDLAAPSGLPDWSRAHVVAHLARNADALVNLLTWARTGIETPMYPSREAREAGIAETAALDAARLRTELVAATARFVDAVRGLPGEAWSARVRTLLGREVPATEVPWMRCIEVVVHAVDLDAGVGFADVDEGLQAAICEEVLASWARRGETPDIVLFAGDREWGSGAVAVSGPLPAVTGWLTGRSRGEELTADGDLPALPRWM